MKLINKCLLVVLTIQLFFMRTAIAQTKDIRFEVPARYVSLIFADDPACPLKLSGPSRVIAYSNGAFSFGYGLTNKSNANVESFLVKEMDWYGNRIYDHPSTVNHGWVFSPGVMDYTLSEQEMANLDPFDKITALKNGVVSGPNRFWVVMVIKVKLSDGTVYDVSGKYDRFNDFLDQPFSKARLSSEELSERETKLRDLVARLPFSN